MARISLPASFLPSFLSNLSSFKADNPVDETDDTASKTTVQPVQPVQPALQVTENPAVSRIDSVKDRNSLSARPNNRSRTMFSFNHPPPRTKANNRLKIRPRLLLQIHQVPKHRRPFPVLDILQSTTIGKKLLKRCPRRFKGAERLGVNDLVVVSSDSYVEDASEEDGHSSGDDEKWNNRDVVATICQQDGETTACAEICFSHGGCWQATPLANGSYDFLSTDDGREAIRVRWVPRNSTRRGNSNLLDGESRSAAEKRYTFSIINSASRRHPVIASMTRRGIDIVDRYPSMASSSPSVSDSSSPMTPTSDLSYFENLDPRSGDSSMIETDDQLRSLIVLTGTWVAFMEYWSSNFNLHEPKDKAAQKPITQLSKKERVSSMPMVESRQIGRPASLVSQALIDTDGDRPLKDGGADNRSSGRSLLQLRPTKHIRRSCSAGGAYLGQTSCQGRISALQATPQPLKLPERSPVRLFRRKRLHVGNEIVTEQTKDEFVGKEQADFASLASSRPSVESSGKLDELSASKKCSMTDEQRRISEPLVSIPGLAETQQPSGKRSAKAQLKRWSGLNFFSHSTVDG